MDSPGANGNSGATIRRKLGIIRAALGWPLREGVITKVPAFTVIQCTDSARYMPPTQDEVTAIYAFSPPHLRRVLVLGFQFGMRVGKSELLRLTWSDIDLEARIIRDPNAKKGARNKFREVPIRYSLCQLLHQW